MSELVERSEPSQRPAVTRRLAAILAADVAAYSRLMGADEEGTLARLNAHRRHLIDPKIQEHRGRIVKTTGDGMLVEFASVVDAVRCAVEFQRGMVERDAELPAKDRIEFRVGINLGDIIVEGDDIFGDGVNIAARLEGLAEPGGICVSRTVRNQVRDKLPYEFQDIGEQVVKNIARPVRADALSTAAIAATPFIPVQAPVEELPRQRRASRNAIVVASLVVVLALVALGGWWLWPRQAVSPKQAGAPAAPVGTALEAPAPRLSIVVLPFANLSNDPDQEYFSDAVTDDLTTDLSRIEGSFVISRLTAFTYKGKPVDAKQIGHDLGVRYVLEGSVRRLGEQVQVNVQLIDADSGAHVWADRFETDRRDLPKAQSEITARLAFTLKVGLIEAAGRQIAQVTHPDARDLIMRGWAKWYERESETSLTQMQEIFERALELDPDSAEARVGIATALVEKVIVLYSKSRTQDMERADGLLAEALARDRSLPRLHWALGLLRRTQARFAEAKIEFENTLALDRNNPGAMLQLGFVLNNLGQPEAALPYFEKALKLTPRHQNIHFFYLGLGECHLYLMHLGEATEFLEKGQAANPRFWSIPVRLAAAFGLRGDIDQAKATLAQAVTLNPEIRSLAYLHRINPSFQSPPFVAMWARTVDVGLRRAGLPDE
jgi:TolB-like protein/class 3 adenylate cyclase/Tfp pilus assembly protein PilF